MVTTKRCAYGTCRNDSRYPQSWERNSNAIQLSFFIILAQLDKIRDGKGGLLSVIAVTRSFVRGGNGPTKESPDSISANIGCCQ